MQLASKLEMALLAIAALAAVSVVSMQQLVESPTPIEPVLSVQPAVESQLRYDQVPVHKTADFITKVMQNPSGISGLKLAVSQTRWENDMPALRVVSNFSGASAVISRLPPQLYA